MWGNSLRCRRVTPGKPGGHLLRPETRQLELGPRTIPLPVVKEMDGAGGETEFYWELKTEGCQLEGIQEYLQGSAGD